VEKGASSSVLRILAWASAAAISICLGFALLGMGWIALGAAQSQERLDRFREGVWWSFYIAVVAQALLPHLLLSLIAWLALARRFPSLERSWLPLLAGLTATAAGCFPLIGWLTFTAWNPSSVRDYLATLLLLTGGTSAALALPRWLFRSLAPGAFSALQRSVPGARR
jgi:hypothetical protein